MTTQRQTIGMTMRFQDLGLLPELVSNAGYDAPTPVQSESIPAILKGRDVLAGAPTGTGKTLSPIGLVNKYNEINGPLEPNKPAKTPEKNPTP